MRLLLTSKFKTQFVSSHIAGHICQCWPKLGSLQRNVTFPVLSGKILQHSPVHQLMKEIKGWPRSSLLVPSPPAAAATLCKTNSWKNSLHESPSCPARTALATIFHPVSFFVVAFIALLLVSTSRTWTTTRWLLQNPRCSGSRCCATSQLIFGTHIICSFQNLTYCPFLHKVQLTDVVDFWMW